MASEVGRSDATAAGARRSRLLRALFAVLPPAIALAVRMVFGELLEPFSWYLFVPAVFLSAWIGGLWMGVATSAVTTILIWWLFVPPEGGLAKEPRFVIPALVYFATGVLFSVFHRRLRSVTRQGADALAGLREKDRELTRLHEQTRHLDAPETQRLAKLEASRTEPERADVDVARLARLAAPSVSVPNEQRVAPSQRERDQETARSEGAPLILVVEPDRDMNRFIRDTLADRYRIVSAFDGKEGLAKARALRPDLVLTDLATPEMSGAELVHAIRRTPAIESTAVLVLTSRADEDLRIGMLREGGLDYVTKPFSAAVLRARVRNSIERQRAEQALGQSRAELNRAQAVAQIGSWSLDVRRNVLTWSDESYRIFGVPLGTPMTYEGFLATVHPDDREYVDRMWQAALQGQPYDIEHRLLIDGQVKWVRERAELMFGPDGELLGGIGTTQDISDRKRIEDALRETEQDAVERAAHVRRLLDASVAISDAVAGLSETSVSAVMSAIAVQARTLLGAEYVAIGIGADPGKPFDPWIQVGVHPEIASRIGRNPRPVGTLGVVALEQRELRERDVRRHPAFRGLPPGHPVMTSFLGVPIRFGGVAVGNMYLANKRGAPEFTRDDQQLAHLLAARAGTALETARLYASEAMERAWMQTVVDQMPEGVLLVDARGVVIVENRSLRALSRSTTDEHDEYGNPVLLDLCLPNRARVPVSDLPYVRALRDGESFSGREHLLRQPDGRYVPVLVSVAPVTTATGARGGAAMIVQDISVLKELERMREEWTSIVAHDLRQPVNTISLHTGILDDTGRAPLPDETRRRSIAAIRASVRALDRMIHDLLDASRIDAQRMEIHSRATSLPALVHETLERSPQLAQRVELVSATGSDRPVLADPGRVEQVLGNLLSNAEKYGDPGTPIRIELVPRERELEVIVTNRGPGIAPEELPRLFGRFERTRSVRERGIPGIGLGLYVCKGLIEAQCGRIWAESTPGETTSFHFTLPFAPERREQIAARP